MRSIFLALVACFMAISTFAQQGSEQNDAPAISIASTIKGDELASYLYVLAADSMMGRETGFPGNDMAASFIASKFDEWGIPPAPGMQSHFQEVAFTHIKLGTASMDVNEGTYRNMKDFVVIPTNLPSDETEISCEEVVFMGYGIDDDKYSDYAKAGDLQGKTIMIYGGEPFDKNGISLISGTERYSRWSYSLTEKLQAAHKRGVSGVIMISTNFKQLVNSQRRFILSGRTIMGDLDVAGDQSPHVIISSTLAEQIMGNKQSKVIKQRDKIGKKGKFKPFAIPASISGKIVRDAQSTPGQNVLAYIEGTDPELKEEVVVITAHYDHVGTRGDQIYNGADDNGSGTSGVMEIAQAFHTAKQQGLGPRRSVLCMLVTGEEKGLLGSQYYAENPILPLENTVANINIDMIGRMDDKHDTPNYTYVIGSDRLSTELHEINEIVNEKYTQLELDYTYNAKDDPNQFYYRSDHYNFARNGVPAIFYFSGVHEDYHQPTDTVDKIMFDKAAKIARLAFHTGWDLANRDERIVVDVKE